MQIHLYTPCPTMRHMSTLRDTHKLRCQRCHVRNLCVRPDAQSVYIDIDIDVEAQPEIK